MRNIKLGFIAGVLALFVVGAPSPAMAQTGHEHVFYEDLFNDIHEIFSSNGLWVDYNLSSLAGYTTARLNTPLTSYSVFESGCGCTVDYVSYIDNSFHLHLLRRANTTITDTDYTAATGAPGWYSGLTSYSAYEVCYADAGGQVVCLHTLSGGGYSNLSALVGAPPAAQPTALTSYTFNQGIYIDYLTNSGHINMLWYDSGSWHVSDLTAQTGGTPAVSGSALTSYTVNNNEYVDYIGNNGQVDVLWYSAGWHYTDLTSQAGAPQAISGTSLTSYTFNNGQYVDYITYTGHVGVVWYSGGSWRFSDLTSTVGAPSAESGSSLASSITGTSFQNVWYVASNPVRDVGDLYYNAGWHYADLTSIAQGQSVQQGSGLAGADY
jgi:hypothetical protein